MKSNTLENPILTAFMAIKSNELGAQMIVCVLDTLIPPNYSRPVFFVSSAVEFTFSP